MKNVKLSIDTGTFIRFWLVLLGFVAAIALAWWARGALITILVSFFLALVLNRPVSFLARHLPGRSRAFATLIAYLLVMAVIGLLFFNVVPIFVEQISKFLEALPSTLENLQSKSAWFGDFLKQYNLESSWENWLNEMQTELGSIASSIGGGFVGILNGLVNVIVNVVFVAVLTFLMLVEAPVWEEKFWRLIYEDKERRQRHQALAKKMYDVVSSYVSGQMIVAAISATLGAMCVMILSSFFTAIQLPLALTVWLVIFTLTFVPMFGAFIGGVLVTILLALYAWPAALIFAAFFILEQQIENNIVSPKIQSKRLQISAMIVLVAVVCGLQLAGLLGALVSIPVAGCIVVLIRDFMKRRHAKRAAAQGEIIDPDNEAPNVIIVFANEPRKFSWPKISRRKR